MRSFSALRVICAVVVTACCAVTVSGCSMGGSDSAKGTANAFAKALEDRQFGDAFKLTTAKKSDFACEWMRSNDPREHGIQSNASLEINDVTVQGDAAVAQATLVDGSRHNVEFGLKKRAEGWKVDVPRDWRLRVAFDAPTVYTPTLGDCTLPLDTNNAAQTASWPILLPLDVKDPTGVLPQSSGKSVSVGTDDDVVNLQGVPSGAAELVNTRVAVQLSQKYGECAQSSLGGSLSTTSCPPQLQGLKSSALLQPTSAETDVDRVWTDDRQSWRFETKESVATVTDGATRAQVPFRYRGTVSTDASGKTVVTIDSNK